MQSDHLRRSQRRRPDLSVNTSRAKSLTSASQPPTTPPGFKPPIPSARRSSRNKTSTRPSTAVTMATTTAGARPPKLANSSPPAAESDSFLNMYNAVDMSANKENTSPMAETPSRPGQRDSHDLSLPSRHVRDSLVSNMLLSLDQFSMGQIGDQFSPLPASRTVPSFDDHRLYSISTATTDDMARLNTMPSSSRGPRHGYSYSSDYDADDASRVSSSIHSRGRRSNSSSGFQSGLGRINSMRESSYRGSQPGTPRIPHSRGGKGSKSSSTNSIDAGGYVQVLGSQRWAQGYAGRSSSFDMGPRPLGSTALAQTSAPAPAPIVPPMTASAAAANMHRPWHIEFSDTFFNDGVDDSAPTPTIPGGPRKLTSAPSMPAMSSYQAPTADSAADLRVSGHSPERRRSVRSSRSATVGRQGQAKFNAAAAPPVPTFDLDSAPAPHVGYEKPKEIIPAPAQVQQPKERPGFFRRVFGSLRDTVSGGDSASASATPPSNPPFASSAAAEASKSQSTPPSRESHHSTHATIQKKPSGFFRRRKKSVTETEAVPPLPVVIQPAQQRPQPLPLSSQPDPSHSVPPARVAATRDTQLLSKPAPSPATSLRRAMSPYLKGSPVLANGANGQNPNSALRDENQPPAAQDEDDMGLGHGPGPTLTNNKLQEADMTVGRSARGFSPEYEPSPKATIRSVEPDTSIEAAYEQNSQQLLGTPSRQAAEPPLFARTGSFLSDNSDNEESPRQIASRVVADHRRSQNKDRAGLSTQTADDALLSPVTVRQRPPSGGFVDDDEAPGSKLILPIEGVVKTPTSIAPSADTVIRGMPSLTFDKADSGRLSTNPTSPLSPMHDPSSNPIDEPNFVVGDPTEDDRQKARNIFDGNEDFIQKDKAASWMGEEGPVRQRTLQAYMDLYNFRDQSIVSALREVCSRLILRAETQQVDRILVTFSNRWCTCNPNHGFKSIDVVHTMCYSIMLLNTDLHMADIESKMTKGQFVKNTMTSMRQTIAELDPSAFSRASILPGRNSALAAAATEDPTAARSGSSLGHHHDDCGPLVKAPFYGSLRAWEAQMETVLKDTYASIRDERLPLFGAEVEENTGNQSGLSVIGMLKRSPSVLSKTPSEGQMSMRGRVPESNTRAGSSRWASKSRSRARVPTSSGGGNGFSSSRTSFDDGNSVWSPTGSSATWSRQSLGRTQGSMSMESFGSSWGRGDYQQSIGFANALSQAIIREDTLTSVQTISDDQSNYGKDNPLLDDESLELAGPPWVKEGLVVHKHHLDGIEKKAKDRNWTEVFAVVQKGQMSIFSFTPNKSLRAKNRGRSGALPKGAVVGGGNWQENATNLGTFGLKQTLASALPSPGYSRQRPNVWALSLPTGAVHLFQVGTPEICKEFVTTANYWSARLSTHPLVGGISNIEYGWSDAIVNNVLVSAIKNESTPALPTSSASNANGSYPPPSSRPGSAAAGRSSMQSRASFRSGSFDFGHGRSGSASSGFASTAGNVLHGPPPSMRHGKLPGDRIHIAEWTPPAQSMRPSNAGEAQQLQVLLAYVKSIEDELQAHNGLRSPMLLAFTPRGHNANKAMANWERKSAHLLREIVKYRTYVDCLTEAERRRAEIYHERDIARRAARGEESISTDVEDGDADSEDEDADTTQADEADTTIRP